MLNLRQYQFGFLTNFKRLAVGILLLGWCASILNIVDFNKARQVEAMESVELESFVQNLRYQKTSERVLESVAAKSLTVSPINLGVAEKANAQLIQSKSNCLNCQNRIIFLDISRNANLSEIGIEALRRSFELSPYGEEDIIKWRLDLASRFWVNLDDDLRRSALSQITVLARKRENRVWLKDLSSDVGAINQRIALIEIDG